MKPWQSLLSGAVVGIFAAWFVAPRPQPDGGALEAAQEAVAQAEARVQRDSAALAAKDDTLAAVRDTVEAVVVTSRLVASQASAQAAGARHRVRTLLDSLGASTAALDTLEAAHAREIAAKDAEIDARDRERAILYRRVEASDSLIASLRVQAMRQAAVIVEEEAIRARLEAELRGARRRERIAEAVAIVVIVHGALSG